MSIKYYVHPISHDLLIYNFDTKEVIVISEVENVRALFAGEVIEDEDYMERGIGHARIAGKKGTLRKKGVDTMSQSERIKDLLQEDPTISSKKISEDTGIPIDTVYSIKSRLKKDGQLETN